MYRVIVERRAAKEIESLPDEFIQTIFDAVNSLKSTPRPHGVKKLIGRDGWRIRINDYRVLYTLDDKQKVVSIYRVKHRRDAYR